MGDDGEVVAIDEVLKLAQMVAEGRITNEEAVAAVRIIAGPAESR